MQRFGPRVVDLGGEPPDEITHASANGGGYQTDSDGIAQSVGVALRSRHRGARLRDPETDPGSQCPECEAADCQAFIAVVAVEDG
jgi:hypothetical protein